MPDQENTFVLKSVENDDRGGGREFLISSKCIQMSIHKFSYIFKIEYISNDPHFSHRLVEYVVECSDSEGMRLWLLTIQSNMRPHGMSLSDLAERNRLKIFEHY